VIHRNIRSSDKRADASVGDLNATAKPKLLSTRIDSLVYACCCGIGICVVLALGWSTGFRNDDPRQTGPNLRSQSLADDSQQSCLGIALKKPGELVIACIGDSITYGNGSHVGRKERDGEGNYPISLREHLASYCDRVTVRVGNFGHSGRTAIDGFRQSYRNSTQYKRALRFCQRADVVVVMLGTNDSKERHWRGRSVFAESLARLVEELCIERCRLVLVAPPPSFPNPRLIRHGSRVLGRINPEIIRGPIRESVEKIARTRHLMYVDLVEYFYSTIDGLRAAEEAVRHGSRGESITAGRLIARYFHDGVHPTVLAHELIAATIFEHLRLSK
jgi:lysophospholipase L1-like esterase